MQALFKQASIGSHMAFANSWNSSTIKLASKRPKGCINHYVSTHVHCLTLATASQP